MKKLMDSLGFFIESIVLGLFGIIIVSIIGCFIGIDETTIPIMIIGIFLVLAGIIGFLMYVFGKDEEELPCDDDEDPEENIDTEEETTEENK